MSPDAPGRPRVVFMGTPQAAVPSLRAVASEHEVVAVYTRRDRPRGRGRSVSPSPVKQAAIELGLDVIQPRTLRSQEAVAELRALDPELVCVAAYGMLLPPDVLEVPTLGCVNVHFSLLPRWRGAAPVERAILAADDRTGVTIMLMDEGLDTGPILLQEETPIASDDTTGSLTDRLADMGAASLLRAVEGLTAGTLRPRPQPDEGVTVAPRVEREESVLDLTSSAEDLERRIRAMAPKPGAYVWFRGRRLKVWSAEVTAGDGGPGTIASADPLEIQTARGRLRPLEVQPEGKQRMDADAFVRGYRPAVGEPLAADGQ